MKNGNRYSFNPRRKIIPQIVAMRTGKFGYTLIVHLASNLIGPNRNYCCKIIEISKCHATPSKSDYYPVFWKLVARVIFFNRYKIPTPHYQSRF